MSFPSNGPPFRRTFESSRGLSCLKTCWQTVSQARRMDRDVQWKPLLPSKYRSYVRYYMILYAYMKTYIYICICVYNIIIYVYISVVLSWFSNYLPYHRYFLERNSPWNKPARSLGVWALHRFGIFSSASRWGLDRWVSGGPGEWDELLKKKWRNISYHIVSPRRNA